MKTVLSCHHLVRRIAVAIALAMIMLTGPGCESAVIAAAGVSTGFALAQGRAEAFISGELKAARLVEIEQGIAAARAAMAEMNVPIKTFRRGEYDAYMMGKAEGGPEFKIHLKSKTPNVTKFEIRIGVAGDQAVSRLVMSRLDFHMGIDQPIVPVEQSPIVAPKNGTATSPASTQPDN